MRCRNFTCRFDCNAVADPAARFFQRGMGNRIWRKVKTPHPSEAELHAFNRGARVDTSVDVVSEHLEECSVCRGRLRELALSDRVLP
jgi:hypothetical protein